MSTAIDYYTILYLFFRLLPMLTAAVLTIAPIFNNNLRGFVYLVGLLLTTATASVMGNYANLAKPDTPPNETCHAFSLSSNQIYARVPLDLAVFGFTFAYLMVSIVTNKLASINISTILFFPAVIAVTLWWLMQNSCFTLAACLMALAVSISCGVAWGYIVKKQLPKHQYLYAKSNRESCTRQSDDTYRCSDVDGNGNLN